LTDKDDKSARFPTFFNGEDITGRIELKLNSKTLKHKGIKAELHGILEKYGTINKTKQFLNLSCDVSRPEEIRQEKVYLNFGFQNVKLPYESYKGDYATIKYYVKIIIVNTFKNAEYEKEFAVVNPYDSSILQRNDEPIQMKVGMKQKLSLGIYFQHKNYNCRGTLKGFIIFNYLNIKLKFMEVQIVRREVIFGDKKCEPAYVARYELIDGVPSKNEKIPIRFFLKSYNLTPTYQNIDNVFCVRYFLNLVIADEDDNRYFKQKEICLFRLYKERRNIYNGNNNNYNNDQGYYNNNYNNDEIYITEPIYEEDYSLDYQPAFGGPNNQGNNNDYDDYDNYDLNPNLPSINADESYDYGNNNNMNNSFNNNSNRGRNNYYNNNDKFNDNNSNNFNRNNTINYDNNRRNTFDNRNDNKNIIRENDYDNRNNINDDNYNQNNNRRSNSNYNYNRNNTYSNNRNNNNINDNYNDDNYDDNNYNNNNRNNDYYNRNNRNNGNSINNNNDNFDDNNDFNNQNYGNRQNNFNSNRNNSYNNNNYRNKYDNNNPSNYHSINSKNSGNSYDESNFYGDDMDNNNIINTNTSNNNRNNRNNSNDLYSDDFQRKNSSGHRGNLMQNKINSEDDMKNIFNSLDKNINKDELKKNIFG